MLEFFLHTNSIVHLFRWLQYTAFKGSIQNAYTCKINDQESSINQRPLLVDLESENLLGFGTDKTDAAQRASIYDVRTEGGSENTPILRTNYIQFGQRGEGVTKSQNFADVTYGSPFACRPNNFICFLSLPSFRLMVVVLHTVVAVSVLEYRASRL